MSKELLVGTNPSSFSSDYIDGKMITVYVS